MAALSPARRGISALCLGFAMLLSLLGSALLGFEAAAADPAQYTALQDRFDLYDEIGVSRAEMVPAMEAIAAYLRGETDDYNRTVTMFGRETLLFNDRELAHMVDVEALFRLERTVRTLCLVLSAFLALSGLFLARHDILRCLRLALITALALAVSLVVFCAAAYAVLGFDAIFLGFHHLFFTNDLWLMDYSRDAMIRMFPSQFFESLLSVILIRMAAAALKCAVGWLALWGCIRCLRPRTH